MRLRMVTFAAVLALTSASLGRAQETTGTVTGRVTDAQGLAIPGVTVTLIGPQGAKTFTSDADGRYSAPLLLPGTYTVKAVSRASRRPSSRTSSFASGRPSKYR